MSMMRPFTSMRSEFDRLFSEWEREFLSPGLPGQRSGEGLDGMPAMWSPPINLIEKEKEVLVTVSVPGLRPEDINVEVEGNTLSISGESRQDSQDQGPGGKYQNYYRHEIRQGKFYRQVPLPTDVEAEKANARFENGMLTVSIPKSSHMRRHKIQIGE